MLIGDIELDKGGRFLLEAGLNLYMALVPGENSLDPQELQRRQKEALVLLRGLRECKGVLLLGKFGEIGGAYVSRTE